MLCVTAPVISARDRLALSHRRWPSGKPRLSAFCRSAPTVRFMTFAIFFTGDLLREYAFSSRTSAFDQVRRLVRLARLLAIRVGHSFSPGDHRFSRGSGPAVPDEACWRRRVWVSRPARCPPASSILAQGDLTAWLGM